MPRSRGTRAVIDLSAIRENLQVFRGLHAGPIIAVVKADAYGHGLVQVVPQLADVDAFAVATLGEALQVRGVDSQRRILLLEGVFNEKEMQRAVAERLDPVLHQDYQLDLLDAVPTSARIDVWLKLDTGMNRLGFAPHRMQALVQRLRDHRAVRRVRLMTHYAQSDQPDCAQTRAQRDANRAVQGAGLEYSFSNTAAVLGGLADAAEWARIGIGMFGISPISGQTGAQHGLRPAMQLLAKVIAVKEVAAGGTIGYGAVYTCPHDLRVAIVGIGYADGYPWSRELQGQCRVGERLCRIVGRVSMDMLAVDISELPQVKCGDDVLLWGDALPAEQLADSLDLIPYVLTCGITRRVQFKHEKH